MVFNIGGIGVPELILICACGVVLVAAGIGVAIWQIAKRKK